VAWALPNIARVEQWHLRWQSSASSWVLRSVCDLRFWCLFLRSPAAIIFVLIVGLGRGDSFGSIVLAMVIVGIALQVGYLVGIVLAKRIQ